MAIARIENGAVAERREIDLSEIPEHKRYLWRRIEGDPPTIDAACYTMTGPVYQIEADRVRRVWTVTPRDLAQVKAEASARIDGEAGAERLRYITDAPGQDLTYDRKRREALAAIDDPDPSAAKYPLLAVSIGLEVPRTGNVKTDFDAIAALVIGRETAWAAIAASIEGKRLAAKKAVAAAQTVDDVAAAARVVW